MTDPLFDVSGRVGVVTGGHGQLGAELTVALWERGMRVAIVDLAGSPKAGAADLTDAIASGDVRAFAADVADREAMERVLEDVAASWGIPYLLINAAAIDARPGGEEGWSFESYPTDSLQRVLHANITGTVVPCQVFGAAMARAGRGSIVNVSSIYGMLSPDQRLYDYTQDDETGEAFVKPVGYSVTKSAILNLTRYLATYWGRAGVRVNTLTPHGIANDQPEEFVRGFCERSPMRRMMFPGEAVGAVVFLASDASSYVTGANVVVDGGWSAW